MLLFWLAGPLVRSLSAEDATTLVSRPLCASVTGVPLPVLSGLSSQPPFGRFLETPNPVAVRTKVTSFPLGSAPPRRPGVLPALHVSFAALQVLDAESTLRGVSAGGYELNLILGAVVDRPAAFFAVKGGMTALTPFLNERLWKRNRKASVILITVIDSAYVLVVANNYRQLAGAKAR